MQIGKEKLAYAISAIWGLISLPVSEVIYDDMIEESGLLMRLFALLLALMPVWLVLGWRWLTNNKPISAKFWLAVTAAGILTAIGFVGDYSWDELTWIPIIAVVAFLVLVWTFERGDMLWWRKKSLDQVVSMPTPKDFQSGISALVKLTEELSNEIHDELRRLAPDLKLPIPLHQTEALACAYGLVHFNLRELGFQKGSKVVTVFSGYNSLMITNYLSIATPKIPGIGGLTDDDMKKPKIREPAKKLLEMKEEFADTVHDNLARNAANPFYPFYDGLRPFVSKEATASDMNATFDSVFSKWNGKAKRGVESYLRHTA